MQFPPSETSTLPLVTTSFVTAWNSTSSMDPLEAPNTTFEPIIVPPCQWILYADITDTSSVRWWDLLVLVPNALFLLFLLIKCYSACAKFRATPSHVFTAFYVMVCMVGVVSVVRCIVFMTVYAAVVSGHTADKVLWLVLRFFLLATEMSVVTFGLLFGHLDSRTSVRRVLFVTCFIALIYSLTQGALEFSLQNHHYHGENFDLFGHGGMLFWFASSLLFWLVYTTILILPRTPLRYKFPFPTKRSFYVYVACLATLNLVQAVGSMLLYQDIAHGICLVDITSYIYFTLFAPFVYLVFLRGYFSQTRPRLQFSYKSGVDESGVEDDRMTLPDDFGASAAASDTSSMVDSTPFDTPNPFYVPQRNSSINNAV